MSAELKEPIAVGRTAQIFAWGPGQVLKLYFAGYSREDAKYEARTACAVQALGLPVPRVGALVQVGERCGLIYQRVEGCSMTEQLMRRPWQLNRQARILARLQFEIHAHTGMADIPPQRQKLAADILRAGLPEGLQADVLSALAGLPDGDSLCHGDIHPGNILLTEHGPVVLDWADASCGSPLADLARSSILMVGAAQNQAGGPILKFFTLLFHLFFQKHYFRLKPGAELEYRRWLPVAAAARLSEGIPELKDWLLAQVRGGVQKY